jgi:hypothetical protein
MAPATRFTRSIGDAVRERLRDAPPDDLRDDELRDELPEAPRDAPRADDEPLALREDRERELDPRDEEREELREDFRDDLREEPRLAFRRPPDDFLLEPDRPPPRELPPDLFLDAMGVLLVRSECGGCVQDSRT